MSAVSAGQPAGRRWGALALLGALLLAGGLVLVHQTRGSSFFADEWDWILGRRHGGIHAFLDPHQEHLSLVPLIVYRILFATTGIRHYGPYLAVLIAAQLVLVSLVFWYALPRVGPLLALLAGALVMFFGPGSVDFLWAFQMAWLFAVAAGVGALLALDRRDRFGDAVACMLLAVSLASAGPGVAFALAIAIEIAWTRPRREWWIALVPLALYVVWWIFFQQAGFQRDSLFHLTTFIATSAATAVAGLAGLLTLNVLSGTVSFAGSAPVLLIVVIAAIAWRAHRLGRLPARAVTLILAAVILWLITALSRGVFLVGFIHIVSAGNEDRYVYPAAVLLVLLGAEMLDGWRPRLPAALVIAVLGVAAVVSNVGLLREEARYLRESGADTRAYLGTLDMTRTIVPAGFPSAGFSIQLLTAGAYFAAERELGSDGMSPAALAGAPDPERAGADRQLIVIHRVALVPVTRGLATRACRQAANPGPSGAVDLRMTVPPGGLVVTARSATATVAVRRFAAVFTPIGTLAPGAPALLRIGPDAAPEPWYVELSATGGVVTVCGASGSRQ